MEPDSSQDQPSPEMPPIRKRAKITCGFLCRQVLHCASPVCTLHAFCNLGGCEESRRDSDSKPRVASLRATLGNRPRSAANPERVVAPFHPEPRKAEAATLSGLEPRLHFTQGSSPALSDLLHARTLHRDKTPPTRSNKPVSKGRGRNPGLEDSIPSGLENACEVQSPLALSR